MDTVDVHDAPELDGAVLVDLDVDEQMLRDVKQHDRRRLVRNPRWPGRRERTCEGKFRYGRRAAHRAARVLRDAQGNDVYPYPCSWCGSWHVGHQRLVGER